jgi:hypothetical protein
VGRCDEFPAVAGSDPAGIFASINGFAWLAYFLWISGVSVAMIRVRAKNSFTMDGQQRAARTTALLLGSAE